MKKIMTFLFVIVLTISAISQERKITGVVSDDMGPIADISVKVKRTNVSAVTDFDGNYTVTAQKGDVLLFTHISYVSISKKVEYKNVINVTMKGQRNSLEEVVITAYGRNRFFQRKKNYSVKKHSISKKRKRKSKGIRNSLAGKITGVQVTSTGAVGSSTRVVLRGVVNISQYNKPLYVIDGIIMNNVDTNFLDSNNIKSVNVIKGATSDENKDVVVVKTKSGTYKSLQKQEKSKIYIVNGKKVKYKDYEKIPSKDIKSFEILKNKSLIDLYGKKAKKDIVSITTFTNHTIENENYKEITENQFEHTSFAPLSTFSIDVDKASYSNVRRMINNGQTIPQDAVKIEEMINYFNYSYKQPTGEHPFSIQTEVASSPYQEGSKIVKIGLQGKNVVTENIPASNLVFLIDVSGSMGSSNKLPLLKSAFKVLIKQLRNKDKVSIVVYAGAAGVVLKPTSGDNKIKILEALQNLKSGGSTAGGEGIELAYKLAQENFIKNGNNRIILATDGDFNVGSSNNQSMEELIIEKRKSGVFLTVLGFGMGNYKDSKLEILADKGNGNHAYIDTMQEAKRILGTEFSGTLYTIAKDVKIQVEFNPNLVAAYRLIGYENRLLANEDFVDDTKDAGELGSNHSVTALYEVIPVGMKSDYLKKIPNLKYTQNQGNTKYNNELVTVKLRYKNPKENISKEIIHLVENTNMFFNKASNDFKFVTSVAMFGMKLRKSKFTKNVSYKDIKFIANNSKGTDNSNYRAEFIRLVETVSSVN